MKNSLITVLAIASTIALVKSKDMSFDKETESSINFGLTNQPFNIQKQMETSDSIRQRNQVNQSRYSQEDDQDYLKIKNLRKSTKRELRRRSSEAQQDAEDTGMGMGIGFGIGFPMLYSLPIWICWCKMCCTYDYREGRAEVRCKKCCSEPVCKYKRPIHFHENSLLQKAKKDGIVGAPNQDIMKFMNLQQQASALNQLNQMAAQMNMMNPYSNPAQMNMGMGMQNQGMMTQGGQIYQPSPALMNMQYSNNMVMPTQQNHLMTDASLIKPNQVGADTTLGIPVQNTSMMQNNYGYDPNTSFSPLNQQQPQNQQRVV
eukprot:403347603